MFLIESHTQILGANRLGAFAVRAAYYEQLLFCCYGGRRWEWGWHKRAFVRFCRWKIGIIVHLSGNHASSQKWAQRRKTGGKLYHLFNFFLWKAIKSRLLRRFFLRDRYLGPKISCVSRTENFLCFFPPRFEVSIAAINVSDLPTQTISRNKTDHPSTRSINYRWSVETRFDRNLQRNCQPRFHLERSLRRRRRVPSFTSSAAKLSPWSEPVAIHYHYAALWWISFAIKFPSLADVGGRSNKVEIFSH